MKNFLKNNWFKLVISFGIILTCVSVGYYFFIYLPNTKIEQKILENQIKCQEAGYKLYKSQVEENKGGTGTFGNPEFKFNEKLNTCLYKRLFIDYVYTEYSITDVYRNKTIVMWSKVNENNQWKDIFGNEQEWQSKSNELFGD